MATPIIMPRQGQSVESCIITKWHKKIGDKVSVGDMIFSYETDKASFDEEAKIDGILLSTFFEEGDDVECLLNVCVVGQKNDDFAQFNPKNVQKSAEIDEKTTENDKKTVKIEEKIDTNSMQNNDLKISPRAKNLAAKQNIDISKVIPSGPNGRIIEADIRSFNSEIIENFTEKAVETVEKNDYTEIKVSNIRKTIAKNMHNSLSTMAQLTLNSSFDATEILAYRAKIKAQKDSLNYNDITLNDIVLYAACKTILSHKECNAHYFDDKMLLFKHVNLGVAMDTPRGLMVPTVFNADLLTLNELSGKVKVLIDNCKSGSVSPDLLQDGTFTVTNLGSLGITSFTPVINPPQTTILGVNTLETKIKVVNGEINTYQSMGLSLTFDHRALDGAPAAKFLQDLCKNLENFTLLLAK